MSNEADFQQIRKALEDERQRILRGLAEHESLAEIPETIDDIELANQYETRMLSTSLDELSAEKLDRITQALGRLNKGTYGVCLKCNEMIPVERLIAMPYTELCITCQARLEGKGKQGRKRYRSTD